MARGEPPIRQWNLIEAHDINDNGWIVGSAYNPSGQYYALILIPEPATLGLLVTGGLTPLRRRRM